MIMKKNMMACVLLALAGMLMPVGSSASDGFADESRNTVRILEGDNSDPSIVRHGDAYYLVHSSFVYTPGLVVYKSYDLVNWTYCSTALNHFAGDVWAPDIVMHNGRFYIYFPTLSSHGKTSMVTWAYSPEGPWSEPVDLNVGGIDPEHVVDGDGRRWLLMSSGDMYPLTADGCKISGKPVSVYKGWPIPEDWDIESFSMEGLNVKRWATITICLPQKAARQDRLPATWLWRHAARACLVHGRMRRLTRCCARSREMSDGGARGMVLS